MIIFHYAKDLAKYALNNPELWRHSGFVPTMGALHEGHISLIHAAKQVSTITICSIFVNPSQFNDAKDFEKYPITLAQDIRMLEEAGCGVLFLPSIKEMYPDGWKTGTTYDLGSLETLLEGHYRPGHFQGVSQAVHRLLELVQPTGIFMGEKDFQQCMVVRRLLRLKNLPVTLHTCPTLREADGLAMSSRNMRLSPEQRLVAPAIYRAMQQIQQDLGTMPLRALEARAAEKLIGAGFRSVDYVSIATPATLEALDAWVPGTTAVVLVAAFLGEVRLIDNLVVGG